MPRHYEAFWEGFVDYRHGLHHNPYGAVPTKDVAQAWDRGQETGLRVTRASERAHAQLARVAEGYGAE